MLGHNISSELSTSPRSCCRALTIYMIAAKSHLLACCGLKAADIPQMHNDDEDELLQLMIMFAAYF